MAYCALRSNKLDLWLLRFYHHQYYRPTRVVQLFRTTRPGRKRIWFRHGQGHRYCERCLQCWRSRWNAVHYVVVRFFWAEGEHSARCLLRHVWRCASKWRKFARVSPPFSAAAAAVYSAMIMLTISAACSKLGASSRD